MAAVKHVDDWTLLGNYREHPSSSSYTQKYSTKIMILLCGGFSGVLFKAPWLSKDHVQPIQVYVGSINILSINVRVFL